MNDDLNIPMMIIQPIYSGLFQVWKSAGIIEMG